MKRLFCLLLVVCLNCAPQPVSAQSDRSKLTAANYDRIRSGMTTEEVKTLLGTPFDILTDRPAIVLGDGKTENVATYIYQRRDILVTIGFRKGYVVNKWWSAESEVVETDER